jgi:uncharacterized protein
MRKHFKKLFYLVVLFVFNSAHAGSYDDYFVAIKQDDAAAIQNLLTRGFDANARDPKGLHGLFLALREPSLKTAHVLLAWPKTDVNAKTLQDETPLMMAALKGHAELVAKLITRGADVNKTGWAPLHYAATSGHIGIISQLLENHAYIDAESPNGSTPLMMAAQYGTPATVKLLLESGADPLLKNSLGLSAIDFAQRASRVDSANLIATFVRSKQPKGTW